MFSHPPERVVQVLENLFQLSCLICSLCTKLRPRSYRNLKIFFQPSIDNSLYKRDMYPTSLYQWDKGCPIHRGLYMGAINSVPTDMSYLELIQPVLTSKLWEFENIFRVKMKRQDCSTKSDQSSHPNRIAHGEGSRPKMSFIANETCQYVHRWQRNLLCALSLFFLSLIHISEPTRPY